MWGLGAEVAELEAGMLENRRKWAVKRRHEIAAKAIAAGGRGGVSRAAGSATRKSALKSTGRLPAV